MKSGFRFHVSYEPSGVWVVLAVAVAVAYMVMILFPTLPPLASVPPLVAVEGDRAAATRAGIPTQEWVAVPNSTGTYNLVPADIAPTPAPAATSK
jgi:hypothetical protein